MTRYFHHAIRKIKRNPFHFLVNFIGLFIGFTVLLLISSFINNELQYDRQFSKSDRIFLLGVQEQGHSTRYLTNSNLGPSLKDDLPGIEENHFYNVFDADIQYKEDVFKVEMASVDSVFFKTFHFPVISGSEQQLENLAPGHVAITDELAERIFGKTDVVGESFFQKDNLGYVDTYIIDGTIHLPKNTSIRADVFVSSVMRRAPFTWRQQALVTYQWVLLKEGVNADDLEGKLAAYSLSHGMPRANTVVMTPLRKIHFSKNAALQLVFHTRNVQIIYLLIFVTLMVLTIVMMNHINFSLHYSLNQSKELGIRKAMGAQSSQLSQLFLSDTTIHFLFSVPLAYYTAYHVLPLFGGFLGIQLDSALIWNMSTTLMVIFAILLLVATSYLYYLNLAKQKVPQLIVNSTQKYFGASFGFRKTLVIAQLGLSAAMVIISIGMFLQAKKLKEMPIGFDSDYLITLPNAQLREHYAAFKSSLLNDSDILSYTTSSKEIGALQVKSDADTSAHQAIQMIVGDFDFVKTLGIKMKMGRDFDNSNSFQRKYSADYMLLEEGKEAEFQKKLHDRPIIVSEDLLHAYGIDNPIGAVFSDRDGQIYGTIIGVCEPFELGPQKTRNSFKVILGDHDMFYGGFGYLRLKNKNISGSLAHIEQVWKQFLPGKTFEYAFVDSKMERLYQTETALTTLSSAFTLLSIILSTLGVLGLFVIIISQRTKEIGIRKVLGASVSRIILLMMQDTFLPAVIAVVIAIPIGALVLHFWLLNYAYRIDISWWIFVSAGVVTLLVTGIPVVLKTLQAASVNPVKSLRDE